MKYYHINVWKQGRHNNAAITQQFAAKKMYGNNLGMERHKNAIKIIDGKYTRM